MVTQSLEKLNRNKYLLINALELQTKNKEIIYYKNLSKYINIFYKKLIKKSLDKSLLYDYYRQLIIINESKFNYNYLQYLKIDLEKIYNKNVEFNLIILRYLYLNSNLLNIDSSYRVLSSVLLKGNLKANVQHTKLKSKTRIGSFGIKG